MSRPRLMCAGLLMLMLVIAGNACGELFGPSDRAGHLEVSVQTRYVGSNDFTGEGGSRLSVEDDLGWGFNVGYNIDERFNVGGAVSWRTVDYSAHAKSADVEVDYSGWMDTANISVNGMWNILANRFTPYLQGSFGLTMVDTNIPAGVDVECWWDPWWGYTCLEYDSTFGDEGASYTLGAGLAWQVMDRFFIRTGYEKLWLDFETADDFDVLRVDVGFLYR